MEAGAQEHVVKLWLGRRCGQYTPPRGAVLDVLALLCGGAWAVGSLALWLAVPAMLQSGGGLEDRAVIASVWGACGLWLCALKAEVACEHDGELDLYHFYAGCHVLALLAAAVIATAL